MKVVTNRIHRTILSQFRCGVLLLKVETWRFQAIPVEYRLCNMCEKNDIETDSHLLLYCSKNNQLRYQFFTKINGSGTLYPNFDYSDDEFKFTILMLNGYGNCVNILICS